MVVGTEEGGSTATISTLSILDENKDNWVINFNIC